MIRKSSIWAALLAAFVIFAAACGDDSSDEPSGAASSGESASAGSGGSDAPDDSSGAADPGDEPADGSTGGEDPADGAGDEPADEPAAAPQEPVVLTMAWPQVPSNLDSAVFQGLVSHNLGVNYMGTLFRYDPDAATPTEVVCAQCLIPELATEAVQADDGLSYTISLREGVMSPHGNEMTADDVKWSFDRANEISSITGAFLFSVANVDRDNPIEVIDDYTVKYNLTANNQIALSILTWYGTGIFDTTQIIEEGGVTDEDPWAEAYLTDHIASFGAYGLNSITPGEEVRLAANPNYWRGPAAISDVVVRALPDPGNRVQLLLAGDIDYTYDIQFDQVEPINNSENAYVIEAVDTNRDNLVLNHQDPVLAMREVRQAINMAINRDNLVVGPYANLVQPALDGLSSYLPHPPGSPDKLVRYDPDAARALLESVDIPDDWSLTISYNLGRPGPHAEEVATLIAADLTAIGLNVQLNAVAALADFEADVGAKAMQSWLYTERPIIADPAYTLSLYLGSTSFLNNSGYASDEYDAAFREALITAPSPERDALLTTGNEIILEDAPIAYLVERPDFQAFNNSVDGFKSYPDGSVFIYELTKG